MRLAFLLAYVGTNYHGWQIQEKSNPPPTIQGIFEKALSKVSGGIFLRTFAAGRTDSGVHAHAQVAHCDLPDILQERWQERYLNNQDSLLTLQYSLNALLPNDINIIAIKKVASNFHARKDALSKTYIYDFWQESRFLPPYLYNFVWSTGKLDLDAMLQTLPYLQGEHDFASLQNAGTDIKTSIRTINKISLESLPNLEFYQEALPRLRLVINANGFLKQMVRNIAGLLYFCGTKRLKAEAIPELLAKKERKLVPSPTAPAAGLTLAKVVYARENDIVCIN